MVTSGIVREWHDEEGWGVIDAPDTPGGCWAHFSSVGMPGYRRLSAGQVVTLDFEDAEQDGYAFRAIQVGTTDEPQWASCRGERSGAAYSSTLTVRYDTAPVIPPDPPDRGAPTPGSPGPPRGD